MKPLDEVLAEIEARASAATPGPWVCRSEDGYDYDVIDPSGRRVFSDGSACGEYGADIDLDGPDAAFIMAARTDVPRLVAALREAMKMAVDLFGEGGTAGNEEAVEFQRHIARLLST